MPTMINEIEVASAPPPPSSSQQAQGDQQAQADTMREMQNALRLEHERKRRLAEY